MEDELDLNNQVIQSDPILKDLDSAISGNKSPSQVGETGGKFIVGGPIGESQYDTDLRPYQVDLELDELTLALQEHRARKQPWYDQLANGAVHALSEMTLGTIGNLAAAVDVKDYYNTDEELGNWLTDITDKAQEALNEKTKIYRKNPGKALDVSDSGWWYDTMSSLLGSVGSFAISGGIAGKALTGLSKMARINKLANSAMGVVNAEKAGNIAGTVANAVMLNQMEGLDVGMQVQEEIYNQLIAEGVEEPEARKRAVAAGTTAVNVNKMNVFLNLTSANLFFKTPRASRLLLDNPAFNSTIKRSAIEGVQESAEEIWNNISSDKGKAVGLKEDYGITELYNTVASMESLEAAILGFAGGMGQTIATKEGVNRFMKTQDPETGQRLSIKDYNKKKYQEFKQKISEYDRIAEAKDVNTFTNVFKAIDEKTKINDAIQEAYKANDTERFEELTKFQIERQAVEAFNNGTTEHLIKLYEGFANGEQLEGMPSNYKEKAYEAIETIKNLEKVYNRATKYINSADVFHNRARVLELKKKATNLRNELSERESEIYDNIYNLTKDSEFSIEDRGLDFFLKGGSKSQNYKDLKDRIESDAEFVEFANERNQLQTIEDVINDFNQEYKKLISEKGQKAHIEKLQKQAEKVKEDAEKQLEEDSEKLEEEAIQENKDKQLQKQLDKQEEIEESRAKEDYSAQSEMNREMARLQTHTNVGETITLHPSLSKEHGDKTAVKVESDKENTVKVQFEDGSTLELSTSSDKNIYNPATVEDDSTSTEGGDSEPISQEDVDEMEAEIPTEDFGARVISSDQEGNYLDWIQEQYPEYIEYELNPVDKKGTEVRFEINNAGAINDDRRRAVELYKAGQIEGNEEFLSKHLPLKAIFIEGKGKVKPVSAPIETMPSTKDSQREFMKYSIHLRSNIIEGLKKTDLNNIKGVIQDQYKGVLKLDNSGEEIPQNLVTELYPFKNLKTKDIPILYVNGYNELQKTDGTKLPYTINGKGEIYTIVPMANGKDFPLKLNVRKINENEAEILYRLYHHWMTTSSGKTATLKDIPESTMTLIKEKLSVPLKIIGKGNDTTIKDIIDFLIWDATKKRNSKSTVGIIENGNLIFGSNEIKASELADNKDKFKNWLVGNKRHHIKIKPKANDLNVNTHLGNLQYKEYMFDSGTINTNAVVNEPMFQKRTQIYLETDVKVKGEKQTEVYKKTKPSSTKSKQSSQEQLDNIEKRKQEMLDKRVSELEAEGVFYLDAYEQANAELQDKFTKMYEEGVGSRTEVNKEIEEPSPAISKSEYDKFIDTGEVDDITLESIAGKVKSNKKLTDREISIYQEKASEIEDILKSETIKEKPEKTLKSQKKDVSLQKKEDRKSRRKSKRSKNIDDAVKKIKDNKKCN